MSLLFQFHKGTIKAKLKIFSNTAIQTFNSIKVQLRQLTPRSVLFTDNFQFHKGTIKAIMTTFVI